MDNEHIGHAIMCVRMKLNTDEKSLTRRADKMTDYQTESTYKRVQRGQRTLAELERMRNKCAHNAASYVSPGGAVLCTVCGEPIPGRQGERRS